MKNIERVGKVVEILLHPLALCDGVGVVRTWAVRLTHGIILSSQVPLHHGKG